MLNICGDDFCSVNIKQPRFAHYPVVHKLQSVKNLGIFYKKKKNTKTQKSKAQWYRREIPTAFKPIFKAQERFFAFWMQIQKHLYFNRKVKKKIALKVRTVPNSTEQ